jgi:hypothetical protein
MLNEAEWRPDWALQKLGPQLVSEAVRFEMIAIAIYIAGQIAIWRILIYRRA